VASQNESGVGLKVTGRRRGRGIPRIALGRKEGARTRRLDLVRDTRQPVRISVLLP
jgi:hypothetical protein